VLRQCASKRYSDLINTLLGKVFGTKNERELKRLMPQVEAINALEPQMKQLSDEQLRAKTDEFRQRILTASSSSKMTVSS
jgi:preprotein translocase subunit SecA